MVWLISALLISSVQSRLLFISQSALSQQIRRLEHELGFPLFTRTARGLELTEDGVVFCREAQPAVEAWMAFHHAVVSMGKPKNLRLRIVVGARVYSNGLFPDIELLAGFLQNPVFR